MRNMSYITDKKLTLDSMKNMTIDEIVELYRSGLVDISQIKYSTAYQIEDVQSDPTITQILVDSPAHDPPKFRLI